MKVLLIVGMLTIAAPALAQDRWTTAAFLGGALADDATTWRNMRGGYAESDPLYRLTQNQPKGTLISLAITDAVTLWLAHHYAPTHPKAIRVVLLSLGGLRAFQAARNISAFAPIPAFIPSPH